MSDEKNESEIYCTPQEVKEFIDFVTANPPMKPKAPPMKPKAPRLRGIFRGAGHIRIATEYGIDTKHIIETAATLDGEARVPLWNIEVRRDGLVLASAYLFSASRTHANNLACCVHHAFARRALKKSNQNFRRRLAEKAAEAAHE